MTGVRKKPKLLVVLGAGSSMPCGMPSVREIDALMKQWSRDWTDIPVFPKGFVGDGVFNDLWKVYETYFARNPRPQLGLSVNFERVLGEMTALASWVTPPPLGNPLIETVRDGSAADVFTWPDWPRGDFQHRNIIIQQLSGLLGQLAIFMRARSHALDKTAPAFQSYKKIFDALRDEFEVGIYNLNYDNVAINALPDYFTGFSDEIFDPAAIARREEWSFVYHLHGSVHYTLADIAGKHTVKWKSDLAATDFEDTQHLMPNMASNFIPIIPTTLIAGGFKLDQLLSNPSQALYAALVRHIHQADAILTIGYGFGDVHINRVLQNRMDLSPYRPSERPPVVVMTNTPPNSALIADRQGYEFFAWELTHALNTRYPSSEATPLPPSLAELLDQRRLETDYIKRVAVWHSGFLEAESHIEKITGWLKS